MRKRIQLILDALTPHMAVTLDPRDVNPPAAWVGATRVEAMALTGEVLTIATDVVLISQPAGGDADYKTLDTLLDLALPALMSAGASIEFIDLEASASLPDGGGALPAYRLTVII